MKLDAGGKLKIKKPSAAPAVSAASTPGCWRPRSNAITVIAPAMIVQTPAARPSTPSEKLTTFIIATSPITVSTGPAFVIPAFGKASVPTNGSVIAFTATPKCTTITGRDELAGELDDRRQLEAIVERADERDHPCREQHAVP